MNHSNPIPALIRIISVLSFCYCFNAAVAQTETECAGQQQAADVEWYRIASNVYQFRYENHYSMFVVTSEGVVVFDPLWGEATDYYIHAVRSAAPDTPLRAIIYSHWHTDHVGGGGVFLSEFGSKVPIIAHERTLQRLQELDDPGVPLPAMTINDRGKELQFGDTRITLKYIGYGHTDTMLVALLPQYELAYVIDFANHDSVGWRDLPGWPLDELIAMQRRLLQLPFTSVAFGHGYAGPGNRETVMRQIRYYEDLLETSRQSIRLGLSEDQAVRRAVMELPQYRGWKHYQDWFRMNVRGAFRWIAEHTTADKR